MEIKHLKTDEFKHEVTDREGMVMVDFYADWCGPCRMLAPIIGQVADERKDISVFKVNVDDEPELAASYDVMSIPTVIAFKDGKLYKKSVGVVPKDKLMALFD